MKVTKRLLVISFAIIFLLNIYKVYGYSTNQYSISIPSTYTKVSENSFTDENGENVNIQITPFSSYGTGTPYTEETLNAIVDDIFNEMDSYRDEMAKVLRKKNESGLTEQEIQEYVSTFKCDKIIKKEITTISNNNYDGFHIIAKYSMGDISYYVDQYMVASGKNIYTLSISSSELNNFNSTDIKNIINSFTIKNFQEVRGKEKESLGEKFFIGVITALIFGGIGALINKNKNKNNHSSKIDENKIIVNDKKVKEINLSDPNEVVIRDRNNSFNVYSEDVRIHKETDKKYCINCGKDIEESWGFCNYCGYKLK